MKGKKRIEEDEWDVDIPDRNSPLLHYDIDKIFPSPIPKEEIPQETAAMVGRLINELLWENFKLKRVDAVSEEETEEESVREELEWIETRGENYTPMDLSMYPGDEDE